jgi:hypothetical protein
MVREDDRREREREIVCLCAFSREYLFIYICVTYNIYICKYISHIRLKQFYNLLVFLRHPAVANDPDWFNQKIRRPLESNKRSVDGITLREPNGMGCSPH